MATFFEMPSISPTMELGTLIEWRLGKGDSFTPQTVLAEIGTDKANMEAEVFDDGVLLETLIEPGDEVPPGFPIAIIGTSPDESYDELLEEFEQLKKELEQGGATDGDEPDDDEPDRDETEGDETAEAQQVEAGSPEPEAAADVAGDRTAEATPPEVGGLERTFRGETIPPVFLDPPGDARAAAPAPERVSASPLARRIAADRGVDLHRLQGSGPGGRIVKADVERAPAPGGPAAAGPIPDDEVVRNSPMRKTIARRLLESHQQIPSFYLTASFDMARMVDLRASMKEALPDLRFSYNDLIIAAMGRALREFPKANASWTDKAIVRHGNVDVGMAVALPDGLITPVIRNADRKSISEIATETRELAGRAREGQLDESEYTGATFTVSNLGMMDIEEFTAIINPPEAGILAVGSLQQVPVVEGGELTTGWRMKATMTCDHRVIDGMVGAQFLQVLRKYLENPYLLVV